MPTKRIKSNAEMMREYRRRRKEDPVKYQMYLERERIRNRRRKRTKQLKILNDEEALKTVSELQLKRGRRPKASLVDYESLLPTPSYTINDLFTDLEKIATKVPKKEVIKAETVDFEDVLLEQNKQESAITITRHDPRPSPATLFTVTKETNEIAQPVVPVVTVKSNEPTRRSLRSSVLKPSPSKETKTTVTKKKASVQRKTIEVANATETAPIEAVAEPPRLLLRPKPLSELQKPSITLLASLETPGTKIFPRTVPPPSTSVVDLTEENADSLMSASLRSFASAGRAGFFDTFLGFVTERIEEDEKIQISKQKIRKLCGVPYQMST